MLARRLDRIPFLPDTLNAEVLPRMHLLADVDDADAPDLFTERALQAQMFHFWRGNSSSKSTLYDPIATEERYDKFGKDFLQDIPAAFALKPNRQWDERIPRLAMQRELLHIALFESLCYHFRPTVLQSMPHVCRWPAYKQTLLASHKKVLAAASLRLLESSAVLHRLMGSSLTRFAAIIVPTFEAAVSLLCLCADRAFPAASTDSERLQDAGIDPLGADVAALTRESCLQGARAALARLEALTEDGNMAEAGARTLAHLIRQVDTDAPHAGVDSADAAMLDLDPTQDWAYNAFAGGLDGHALAQYPTADALEAAGASAGLAKTDWTDLFQDLSNSWNDNRTV